MISRDKSQNQSRGRILRAAERLFAANGFSGTGVDAIARAADINKATIYYYFPSKQTILDCLIEEFLQHFMETAVSILENDDTTALLAQSISASADTIRINGASGIQHMLSFMDRWLDHIIGLFTENRDIMRIMFAESVKDGENQQLLFRLSDMIASSASEYQQRLSGLGLPQLNLELVVMKFFGGILPLAYYAVCSDAWAAHYGMTKQALKQGLHSLFHAETLGYYGLTTIQGDGLK
ncbi:MAG: TetR/AcrR family transcriptional regulator [Bacillota bacterium]